MKRGLLRFVEQPAEVFSMESSGKARSGRSGQRGKPVLLATLASVLAATALFLLYPRYPGYRYIVPLGEFRKFVRDHPGEPLSVSGTVQRGSLDWKSGFPRFSLEGDGELLRVAYRRTTPNGPVSEVVLPDTFRDDGRTEATVEGSFDGEHQVFEAHSILAKSGGPYEMRERAVSGRPAPSSL
jgi:cytochrome c-type biogenesis protein CcmE